MIDPAAFPLLDHMTSGLLAIDRSGCIVLWNRQLEQWTGRSRRDMLGEDLYRAYPELAADEFRLRIHRVFDGSAPAIFSPSLHHHVIPCPTDNGELRTQKTTVSYLHAHDLALFCIDDHSEQYRLIDKHRQAASELEKELEQRRQLESRNAHLLAAIDQAGEAIIIIRRDGDIEYANRAFYHQTGWHDTRQQNIHVALPGNNKFLDRLTSVFEDGAFWQGRQQVRRRDGSLFTASVSIAPISDADERVTHAIMIQEDISQALELERKIRDTQKQEALATLIGGIAHDFNNILAGITGQAYLASREVSDLPKTADRVRKLQKLAQEASEIVGQLLTFARQGQVNSKDMPLAPFMKEFCKLATRNIPESIRLDSNIRPGNYPFHGDANQLQQALYNMVQNAVESCDRHPDARIEIGLAEVDTEGSEHWLTRYPVLRRGRFAHIYIRDNGAGISEAEQERIFDPFYTTKQLGSGLGLAMVAGCVRHHHGLIEVESSPGNGATFHIFLPLRNPRKDSERSSVSTNQMAGVRILLVDDDPRVLEPTRELLETIGHHVTTAENGKQAWQTFRQCSDDWDIVITDMVMPEMNGLESARLMRSLRPDIPLIFATAYDQSLVLEDTRKVPNSVLLSKPFHPDDLDQLIARMTAEATPAQTGS